MTLATPHYRRTNSISSQPPGFADEYSDLPFSSFPVFFQTLIFVRWNTQQKKGASNLRYALFFSWILDPKMKWSVWSKKILSAYQIWAAEISYLDYWISLHPLNKLLIPIWKGWSFFYIFILELHRFLSFRTQISERWPSRKIIIVPWS